MILVALIIGSILIVAAIRDTYGSLFTAIGQDVPAFVVWGAAILALGAIGFVPGLKPISRGLMALVLIVIILRNYQGIIGGFQSVASAPQAPQPSNGSAQPNQPANPASPSVPSVPGLSWPDLGVGVGTPQDSAFSSAGTGH